MKAKKRNSNNFILIILLVFTVLQACQRDPLPKNALKKQKFIDVLLDVHMAEAIYSDRFRFKMDSLKSEALYKSVLEKHQVTEEQFTTTVLYYSRHPKDYDKIYSEALSKLSMETEALTKQEEVNVDTK